jgi:hypothetical protein
MRAIKKLEIKIVNRGLDLSETFVPYYEGQDYFEKNWETSLFEAGYNVGNYYFENGKRIIEGRYAFEIKLSNLTIYDMSKNKQIVATVTMKGQGFNGKSHQKKNSFHREYILNKLKEKK